MKRFAQFLDQLRSARDSPCIEGSGFSFTYAQLLDEFDCWSRRLDELCVLPGMVVGLRAEYSFPAIAALLALISRGAIAALIPRSREATPWLTDAHASMLLEFNLGGECEMHPAPRPATHPVLEELRASGDGGVVIFTSGSTGRPKAALQSVERFLFKFQKPGRRFRTLAFLLFDHVAGLDTLFYTLTNGGTLIVPRGRDPQSILNLIASHRVEVLPTSPSFLRLLCVATADDLQHDLSSLKVITYGSEPMDHSTLSRLNERWPAVQISQKYGTTETGAPRTQSRGNESLWIKIKDEGVETRVVDDILWIRSEGTILGYLNAPSPTTADGWYCTGDLVDVDGDWIRFRGRATDTINVGGEKVTPSEVEQVLLEMDNVCEAVAFGEPHALLGQIVAARVALRDPAGDERQAIREIRAHCRQRLSGYKVPVRIELVAGGLANDRQKLRRRG